MMRENVKSIAKRTRAEAILVAVFDVFWVLWASAFALGMYAMRNFSEPSHYVMAFIIAVAFPYSVRAGLRFGYRRWRSSRAPS